MMAHVFSPINNGKSLQVFICRECHDHICASERERVQWYRSGSMETEVRKVNFISDPMRDYSSDKIIGLQRDFWNSVTTIW